MEIFDVKWTRNGEFEAESSSINCREYMEKYLEGSQDKSVVYSFKGELYDMPEDYLCPDFSFFDLKGDSFDGVFFQMQLTLNDKTLADLKAGTITVLELSKKVSKQYMASVKISKYFTIDDWIKHGQNFYITGDRQVVQPNIFTQFYDSSYIEKVECSFYNNHVIDMSQFEYLYGGQDCGHYDITKAQLLSSNLDNSDGIFPIYTYTLTQDRHVVNN